MGHMPKYSKGGTTMLDVLHQRYMDLFQKPMSETMLKKVEESFVSKKVNYASLKLLKYLDTYL